MKIKTIQRGLVFCGIATFLVLSTSPGKAAPQAAESKQMMRENLQKAVSELNLSDDQKTKLRSIFGDSKGKREAILKDANLTDEQKQDKLKELRGSTRSQIDEVLTPDQRTQLAEKLKAAAKPQ
jgi:Spy/CpxP family protein refolding chaperone